MPTTSALGVAAEARSDASSTMRWLHRLHGGQLKAIAIAVAGLTALLAACKNDGGTYTLYRSSVTDETMRVHVATFDARDGEKYNQGNCEIARALFQQQPSVKVRYSCEKGRFRK